jgi:hypothetical protein
MSAWLPAVPLSSLAWHIQTKQQSKEKLILLIVEKHGGCPRFTALFAFNRFLLQENLTSYQIRNYNLIGNDPTSNCRLRDVRS